MKIKTTPIKASWKKICCRCKGVYLTPHRHQHVCDNCKKTPTSLVDRQDETKAIEVIENKTLDILQKAMPNNVIASYVALGEIYPQSWKTIIVRRNMEGINKLIEMAEKQLKSEFHKAVMNREVK
jgi:hypothetical protein